MARYALRSAVAPAMDASRMASASLMAVSSEGIGPSRGLPAFPETSDVFARFVRFGDRIEILARSRCVSLGCTSASQRRETQNASY
jgi:hypothetical protein